MDKLTTWVLGFVFAAAMVVFGLMIGGWFSYLLYILAALVAAGLVIMFVRRNKE